MNEALMAVLAELKGKAQDRTRIPLPDDDLLAKYQARIGFKFPAEYKLFLKEAMNVFYGTKDPLTVTEDGSDQRELSDAIEAARALGVPNDWLPICEDNGDYYCLAPSGRVFFWSHNGTSAEQWNDLASWIKDVWVDGK